MSHDERRIFERLVLALRFQLQRTLGAQLAPIDDADAQAVGILKEAEALQEKGV